MIKEVSEFRFFFFFFQKNISGKVNDKVMGFDEEEEEASCKHMIRR